MTFSTHTVINSINCSSTSSSNSSSSLINHLSIELSWINYTTSILSSVFLFNVGMSNTHFSSATFPGAEWHITYLICLSRAAINFTSHSKWLPCHSGGNHEWFSARFTKIFIFIYCNWSPTRWYLIISSHVMIYGELCLLHAWNVLIRYLIITHFYCKMITYILNYNLNWFNYRNNEICKMQNIIKN